MRLEWVQPPTPAVNVAGSQGLGRSCLTDLGVQPRVPKCPEAALWVCRRLEPRRVVRSVSSDAGPAHCRCLPAYSNPRPLPIKG